MVRGFEKDIKDSIRNLHQDWSPVYHDEDVIKERLEAANLEDAPPPMYEDNDGFVYTNTGEENETDEEIKVDSLPDGPKDENGPADNEFPTLVLSTTDNAIVYLMLDSGATMSLITLQKATQLSLKIYPTTAVQIDGLTDLEIHGEIHTIFKRGNLIFRFDALVVSKIGTGTHLLAGVNFLAENDVALRRHTNTITLGSTSSSMLALDENSPAAESRHSPRNKSGSTSEDSVDSDEDNDVFRAIKLDQICSTIAGRKYMGEIDFADSFYWCPFNIDDKEERSRPTTTISDGEQRDLSDSVLITEGDPIQSIERQMEMIREEVKDDDAYNSDEKLYTRESTHDSIFTMSEGSDLDAQGHNSGELWDEDNEDLDTDEKSHTSGNILNTMVTISDDEQQNPEDSAQPNDDQQDLNNSVQIIAQPGGEQQDLNDSVRIIEEDLNDSVQPIEPQLETIQEEIRRDKLSDSEARPVQPNATDASFSAMNNFTRVRVSVKCTNGAPTVNGRFT